MITYLSLIISITALLISLWGRIESYLNGKEQKQLDQAKRAGNALITAQILKNTLSDNLDSLEFSITSAQDSELKDVLIKNELLSKLDLLKKEYEEVWGFVKAFEEIVVAYESGLKPKIKPAAIEAKISHFNQRKELALFDIEYLKKLSKESLNK